MMEIAGGIILAKLIWWLGCAAFLGICAFIAWIMEGVKNAKSYNRDSID